MIQTDPFSGLLSQDAWPSWVAFALLVLGLLAGAILLLVGGKLLRPGLVLLGAMAGIGGGVVLARTFAGERFFEMPVEMLLPIVGGLVGGSAALALYRFAMAIGAAVSFAGLGALVTIVTISFTGGELPPVPRAPTTVQLLASPAGLAEARRLMGAGSSVEVVSESARTSARSYWRDIPDSSRPALVLGVLGGAVLGLLCGAAFPRFTGALVTGLGGSAAVLACGGALLSRVEPHLVGDLSPLALLAAWASLGLIGAGIQLAPSRSASPTPAPAPA
ncbi:MAG: hypothetical protein HBSAPP03_01670 [Phycisphaerae bacterium]|nr:MAG: hypothetical protein HBSAPP03_01670 [Phycisphaerae bacterium]